MNISNQVQIIYVPWWIRLLVFTLMAASVAVCGYLFYTALAEGGRPDWIAAGTYLLGVVFPVLLLVIVIAGASFGESSILKRTEKMLVKTVPYHLQFIPEEAGAFVDFKKFRRPHKTSDAGLAKISLSYARGRCYADYVILTPINATPLTLRLRVELNVKRANINVSFHAAEMEQLMARQGFAGDVRDFLREKFRHSLHIEALQSRAQPDVGAETKGTIAYSFNREFLTRTVDGAEYIVIVATTPLSEDTVWNPSERVFFAQDLMFMIRAFMQECPEVFVEGAPTAA